MTLIKTPSGAIVGWLLFLTLLLPAGAQASPADLLRVMTLNVAHARAEGHSQILQGVDQARLNLWRIANVVKREQPHVVAFQEIDRKSVWNGGFDHTQFVAERASYPHFYSGNHIEGDFLQYGTALVARLGLTDSASITFDRPFGRPGKGFVLSSATWPGTDGVEVDVVSVHFDFLTDARRREEAGRLIEILRQRDNPCIIMGDLNTDYADDGQVIQMLEEQLQLTTWQPGADTLVTFPRFNKRLDWVLVSGEIEIVSHQVLPDLLSDHRAVLAELRLTNRQAVAVRPE